MLIQLNCSLLNVTVLKILFITSIFTYQYPNEFCTMPHNSLNKFHLKL